MKLKSGDMLSGHLYTNGNRSSIEYKVKVVELLYQADHFYLYKGIDCNGSNVCIKSIRYKSEKKEIFTSAIEYIVYRRNMLFMEHKALTATHPSLPEPLAMIAISNNSAEDEKLFRKFPEWQQLKEKEPILIHEYFAATPLPKLAEQVQLFSLEKRLTILKKIISFLSYMHDQGFLVQALKPENILLHVENDNNIYISSLHYSCLLRPGDVSENYHKVFLLSGQTCDGKYKPDVRIDTLQIGKLLYYLLLLRIEKKNSTFNIQKASDAINKLSSSSSWLLILLEKLVSTSTYTRIHSLKDVLHYLEFPPDEKFEFIVSQASQNKIEIEISRYPKWVKNIEIRLEDCERDTVVEKVIPFKKSFSVSGKWNKEIACGIRLSGNDRYTWWEYQKIVTVGKFPIAEIANLPTNQFGFEWEMVENLESVSFFVAENDLLVELGTVSSETKVIFPLEKEVPYYQKIKVICQPNFNLKEHSQHHLEYEVYIVPLIEAPIVYHKENYVFFEIILSKEQRKSFSQIELLLNQQLFRPKLKEDFTEIIQDNKIIFKISHQQLSLFETHSFSCRILLNSSVWKKGPEWFVDIDAAAIQDINIEEVELGTLKLYWKKQQYKYLDNYEVLLQDEVIANTLGNNFTVQIPAELLIKKANEEIDIAVRPVYQNKDVVKKAPLCKKKYIVTSLENIFHANIRRSISPKFIKFELEIKHYHLLQNFPSSVFLYRKQENENEYICKGEVMLQQKITLEDNEIVSGQTYNYKIRVEEPGIDILKETQEVPQIGIICSLEESNYESCSWNIHIDTATLECIDKDIEIHRIGTPKKIHTIEWDKKNVHLSFSDKDLAPGQKYDYYLFLSLREGEKHEYFMGAVTTKKFELELDIQTSYNSSNISWKPSPQGKIKYVEILSEDNKLLARTKSDSIALENLDPEREYIFPLKYHYFSGVIASGRTINFKTKPYAMKTEAVDYNTDSFRLKWEIEDKSFAMKLKNFFLKVSGNVGEHELNASTRSVQLKQLLPCTTYEWSISARLKSGTICLLSKGEATTDMPELQVNIAIGLIHHITWQYEKTPAIHKIEVHRNDLPLIETDEDELYDSDFKGGHELLYRFFYVMSDGRKLLAFEKIVKSLSMQNLFSAVKIQPGIGIINWDFNEIKKYDYFQSMELYNDTESIYLEDNINNNFVFDYQGLNNHSDVGLPNKSMNFDLAVIGIAPITRKCKKKWTLSIKGIKCQYQKLPTNFKVFKEYSCIYFTWEKMLTNFLDEIILERLSDNKIIYSGDNEETCIFDDNNGEGLEPDKNYQYIVKLKYKNHQSQKKIDVKLDFFSEERFAINESLMDTKLSISWLSNVKTSVTQIGWCKSFQSFVPKFLKRYHFVDFSCGNMKIPIYAKDGDFAYELVYKDCYDNVFYGSRRNVKLGEKNERNTLQIGSTNSNK